MLPTYFVLVYLLLFLGIAYWLQRKWQWFSAMPFALIAGALVLKYLVGCGYGYLFWAVYKGDDTWLYHQLSLTEYDLLRKSPVAFVQDLFVHPYHESQAGTLFNSHQSFWKDLQYNLLLKLLGIFNVASRGNYYINVLFFNAITFWGHYYLYALMAALFPKSKRILLACIFLFPPLLFWQSGIRKDGLVFTALCGCVYYCYLWCETKGNWQHALKALLFFVGLFLVRNFVALSLLPALLAYFICTKGQVKATGWVFGIVFTISAGVFFASTLGPEAWNLPKKMAERQEKFLELQGGSYMPIDNLAPTIGSYVRTFPTAWNHVWLRPYLTESRSALLLFAALETWGTLAMLLLSLWWWRNWWTALRMPAVAMLLSIVLLNYTMIGYTVPFAGAIVRYRVVFEVVVVCLGITLIGESKWRASTHRNTTL